MSGSRAQSTADRTDAEEAAQALQDAAQHWSEVEGASGIQRDTHFLSEAGEGRETTCNIAGPIRAVYPAAHRSWVPMKRNGQL